MRVISPVSKPYSSNHLNRTLGILVCEREGTPPFAESSYIKRLSLMGINYGLELFAFAPWTWDARNDTVKGWSWNKEQQQWKSSRRAFPSIVYDRSWPECEEQQQRYKKALRHLSSARRVNFLNGRHLPNKGKVYEYLSKDRLLATIIPPSAIYKGPASLSSWLSKYHGSAFLKPVGGSQGKRVMAIRIAKDGTVQLTGRSHDNRALELNCANEAEALRRLDRWIGNRAYLVQPFLELKTRAGEPFDLRVLLQKDQTACWTLTGIAARLGQLGSVTANLHGGGTAAFADEVLDRLFGEDRGLQLLEEVSKQSFRIATMLEQVYGRFAEFGLDYGVDRSGQLWFLEANSKPGRTAMGSAGKDAAHIAIQQPLSYAKSILLRLATTDTRRPPLK